MEFLKRKFRDGLKMIKDKTINSIVNIGTTLKSRENRVIIGIVLVGLGGSLIISGYITLPQ
jgi:hypothetical protein